MKKKILSIFFIFIFVFSVSVLAYADTWYYSVGEYAENPTLNEMEALVYSNVGLSSTKYYIYGSSDSYSGRTKTSWYSRVGNGWVFYPNYDNSTVCPSGKTAYRSYIYMYDSSSNSYVEHSDVDCWCFRYWEDDGGELSYGPSEGYYIHSDYSLCNCGYDNSSYYVPIASCKENAKLWLDTKDISYLGNAGDFVEIPKPINVSCYLASSENALYVYYENVDYEVLNDFTTRIWGYYRYTDATGSDVIVSDIAQQDNTYSRRGQFKIDLSYLELYDTGSVFLIMCNRENVGDVNVDSEWLYIEYRVDSDTYIIGHYDKNNGGVSDFEERNIIDYSVKNDSYTGGVNSSVSGIITPSNGDYSFLGGLFNGFGLLGNNGLIAYIGQLFSFLPPEIIILLTAGVSAMVVVALFKLLVH